MNSYIRSNDELISEYNSAILNYISNNGERELHRAYELGRRALDSGELIMNTARIHSEILSNIINKTNDPDERLRIIASSTAFFTEFLSPFEMTFRGFIDVVSNLKTEISIRHQTEEALKQSEKYYKALIENALDIITILDPNGNMIYYSSAVEKVLGYSSTELLNKNAFAFIHPDDVDTVLEIFNSTVKTPSHVETVEFRFRHKNGDWIILESIGKNLVNDQFINGVIVNSRDITDRRNLEELRRKYEFIANASKELMGLINNNYQYEAVNEAYCSAYSKTKEEIIGKKMQEIVGDKTFYESIKEQIDTCIEGNESIYEGWFNLPNLGKRFLEIAYYPYENQRYKITNVVMITRDITDRKNREDIIKKSQIQLSEAQKIANIGSWEWVSNSDLVSCSNEICNIIGLEKNIAEISLKEFLSFIHPDDRIEFNRILADALNNNVDFIFVHKIIRADKSIRFLQTRGKVIHDESDSYTKIIATCQDITKQELTQQAIKASETKYRRLFETSKEGLLLLDAATGIIVDVNPFMIDFLGYSKHNLLTKLLWEIDAVRNNFETAEAFKNVLSKDYVRFEELDLNTAANKKVKIEFIGITYTVNESKVIQCHLWDITERRQLQQELHIAIKQRAEDLRRFAQSIQQAQEEERRRISRELHDDICQRLTALKFQLNIFEDAINAKKKISLRKMKSVKTEINNLINEVRRISSNLRPSALDHFGLVTALRLLCSGLEKLNEVEINFETDIPTFQRYDPNVEIALFRIAQEALANCIKHAQTKYINLKIIDNQNELNLMISDNGKGFRREDKFNLTQKDGDHFGLINMRERTELIGGKFQLDSILEKGTNVNVIVPVTKYEKDEEN